jgi:arylsulfatase A-like enzyme
LWVHYFDHHNPHEPRKEWISDINPAQTEAERFDQELHFADRHWGKLLQEIESSRAAEGYVTIFTADHGEAFDKNHPSEHHKFSLHGEELHVPLVIQTYAQRGHTYRDIVSHLDLVPTLGTLADFQPPLEGEGENLVGALFFGTPPQKRALYSLFYSVEFLRYGSDPFRQIGIRTDQHYLVSDLENRRQYLAAWRTDPLEEADLRQREPGLTGQLTYYLNRQLAELRKDHRAFVDGQEKRR